MMSLSKHFQPQVYFHDIYREQSSNPHGCATVAIQYHAFSSLDKCDDLNL